MYLVPLPAVVAALASITTSKSVPAVPGRIIFPKSAKVRSTVFALAWPDAPAPFAVTATTILR